MTLSKAKRVVLKIGSALLVDAETRRIREEWLASVAADIAHCRKQGQEIIVVTSGAVAVGLTPLLAVTPMVAPLHPTDTDVSDSEAPPLLVDALPVQAPTVKAPLTTALPFKVQA